MAGEMRYYVCRTGHEAWCPPDSALSRCPHAVKGKPCKHKPVQKGGPGARGGKK